MDDQFAKLKAAQEAEKAIVDEILKELKATIDKLKEMGYGHRVTELVQNKGGRPPKTEKPEKKAEKKSP
jgi:hypothetical protein